MYYYIFKITEILQKKYTAEQTQLSIINYHPSALIINYH